MRDLETLQELVRSVTNCDELQKLSGKPFKPSFIDVIMAQQTPQFYNKEQLLQISNVEKLLSSDSTLTTKNTKKLSSADSTPTTKNIKKVTKKRKIEETPRDKKVKSKYKKSKKESTSEHEPLPDLPEKFKNRITELNGHDIKFLMHKKLFPSDTNSNSNRLSMPIKEIKSDFLTEDEIAILNERDDDLKGKGRPLGLEVTLLDPCLREFTLPLKKWKMNTNTYNLIKNWKQVVSANEFKNEQHFHIWSFRVENKLYILLNKL